MKREINFLNCSMKIIFRIFAIIFKRRTFIIIKRL